MTFSGLFDSAVKMVCENETEGNTGDYEERAAYLLATFCHECAKIDAAYRNANGLSAHGKLPSVRVSMDGDFPFADIFAPAAVYYLAAMLTVDENETMSDKFFDLYTDAIASIQCSIPTKSNSIKNCYTWY